MQAHCQITPGDCCLSLMPLFFGSARLLEPSYTYLSLEIHLRKIFCFSVLSALAGDCTPYMKSQTVLEDIKQLNLSPINS